MLAKIIVDHWTNRNVYTKAVKNVHKKLESMYKEFILIRKIFLKGKPSQASIERYTKYKEEKDNFWISLLKIKKESKCWRISLELG